MLIATGKYKGAGFEGSVITDEQKAHWQSIVDRTQESFSAGIARGRGKTAAEVAELADGRVHPANAAKDLGLIDGIQTFEATLAAMGEEIRKKAAQSRAPASPRRSQSTSHPLTSETSMSETPVTQPAAPSAATYLELKNACPGASSDFLCGQLEKSATVAQAQNAWMAEQNRLLSEAQTQLADARKTASAKKPGVEALGDGAEGAKATEIGDPVAEWNEALAKEIERTKGNRQRAVSNLVKKNPGLHAAFVASANGTK